MGFPQRGGQNLEQVCFHRLWEISRGGSTMIMFLQKVLFQEDKDCLSPDWGRCHSIYYTMDSE